MASDEEDDYEYDSYDDEDGGDSGAQQQVDGGAHCKPGDPRGNKTKDGYGNGSTYPSYTKSYLRPLLLVRPRKVMIGTTRS